MADEMEPLARIGRRLRDETKPLGLEMARFSVEPSLDGSAHGATAVFLIGEPEEPAKESDPEFEALIEGQAKAEQAARVEQARQQLEDLRDDLRNPNKGLGLDDE